MAFLKHTEHFDSINAIAKKIDDKAEALGMENLSQQEQTVEGVWAAVGILENGSFQYFFENDLDIGRVQQAYREIGLPAVADLFAKAGSLIAPLASQPDRQTLLKLIQIHETELDRLAEVILSFTLEAETKLSEYIRANKEIFSALENKVPPQTPRL